MENKVNIKSFVIQFAAIAGLFRVLIDIVPKALSFGPISYYSTFFISFILEIILITFIIKRFKTKNKFLTLSNAIKIGVTLMLIVGLCYSTISYIYDSYVDPNFQTDTAIALIEKFQLPNIDEMRDQILESQNKSSPIGILTSTLWFSFLGLIISFISGSILKSKEIS